MGRSATGAKCLAGLGAACGLALLVHCKPPPKAQSPAPDQPALAAARLEVAKSRLAAHRPAEALAWLAAALRARPDFPEARSAALDLLQNHTWHLPESTVSLGHPVTAVDFAPPSSLWLALGGKSSTVVRWDLESRRVEATLFPLESAPVRSLTVDETGRFAVIERAGTALLCDAANLKPIRDLGPLPEKNAPHAVIAFSPDGLLLAHPAMADAGLIWHIRETKSGSILRSSDPVPASRPSGLAARLDRDALTILLENGDRVRIPVSPVQPITTVPQDPALILRHAAFSPDADAALVLLESSPHERPQPAMFDFTGADTPAPRTLRLLELHPWDLGPVIWSGLMRDAPETVTTSGNTLVFPGNPIAELSFAAAPAALVKTPSHHLLSGDASGNLVLHRFIPPPASHGNPAPPQPAAAPTLAALDAVTAFLAGLRIEENSATPISTDHRLAAMRGLDTAALASLFPEIDPQPWLDSAADIQPSPIPDDALAHLAERLVRANARPRFEAIEEAFANADPEAVTAAIDRAGPKGPAAALCLSLALASTHPEWIDACLAQAADLPELVRRIAVSRIAWLQDRKADAIAGWPDAFPDLAHVRQREDWDGWEAADFGPALENLRLCVGEELAKLELPPNPTPEQRQTLFDHLANPATITAVGKPRFAKACLRTALAFAAFPEETEKTFQLASFARNLGESPAVCLRAEAMALTALGDFVQARDRWIDLITNHPVASHEPGDYAEAAYTSFENADPRQAMAILTTGIHRFPHDANFALRAGWVALLTGNAEPAYRYLLTGRQIGYPQEKLENATALMAIAAVQTGASEDAAVFYQELIRIDPAWEKPETIETLPWPEELKASLRQLAW
jgi:tetratricopeptide (TPR) repeat protein